MLGVARVPAHIRAHTAFAQVACTRWTREEIFDSAPRVWRGALAPHARARFTQRFPNPIAILKSGVRGSLRFRVLLSHLLFAGWPLKRGRDGVAVWGGPGAELDKESFQLHRPLSVGEECEAHTRVRHQRAPRDK